MSVNLMETIPEVRAEYARMAAMQAAEERRAAVEAKESKSAYKRPVNRAGLTGFETLDKLDNVTIGKMLKKVALVDLIMAMTGADAAVKNAILGNISSQLRETAEISVSKMESGLLPLHVVERSRDIISDAFLEIMREVTK